MPQRALPGYDDIYFKNSSEEFKNLWNYANQLIAWTTITPLFYTGAIGGSEFLTYNAGKLYVCINSIYSAGAANINPRYIEIFDMANAAMMQLGENITYFNVATVSVMYILNSPVIKNYWFSRIVPNGANYMIFNGYRLTI